MAARATCRARGRIASRGTQAKSRAPDDRTEPRRTRHGRQQLRHRQQGRQQEVDNALNQAAKEVAQRYDFKNVGASIEWAGGDNIQIKANTAERVLAVLDVFETKLVRRGVSLKNIDFGEKEPKPSGKEYVLAGPLKEGIDQENAKKIAKIIRDEGPKGVKAQIQGDELRVTSKSRDDLQSIISLLKGKDLPVALQYTNYR